MTRLARQRDVWDKQGLCGKTIVYSIIQKLDFIIVIKPLELVMVASSGGSFTARGRRALGRIVATLLCLLLGSGLGINLVLAVLLDEVGQSLGGTSAGVLNRRVLAAGGVELDRGEPGDGIRDVVGGRIDLGDGDLGEVSVEGGKLFVLGSETVPSSN